jgi:hypothetical protein
MTSFFYTKLFDFGIKRYLIRIKMPVRSHENNYFDSFTTHYKIYLGNTV